MPEKIFEFYQDELPKAGWDVGDSGFSKGGEVQLNRFGEIVRHEWLKTAAIRTNVEIRPDELIVMPNHLHGIIRIVDTPAGTHTGSTPVGTTWQVAPTNQFTPARLMPNSLGAIIG